MAFLLLFVVLPFVVAALVIGFVLWRSPDVQPGTRTSELLADGLPGSGTLVAVRSHASAFLDRRPMASLALEVTPADGGPTFELIATQSVPRPILRALKPGIVLDVRYSPDRSAGAVILPTVTP